MCILCRMIQKEMLNPREIVQAYIEISSTDPDHEKEILDLIEQKGQLEEVQDLLLEESAKYLP